LPSTSHTFAPDARCQNIGQWPDTNVMLRDS